MKAYLFLFIAVLLFLPLVQANSQACCVMPYANPSLPGTGVYIPSSSSPSAADCVAWNPNSVFVDNCLDASGNILPDVTETACCCDGFGNVLDFGASSVNLLPSEIQKSYCETVQGGAYTPVAPTNGVCDCDPSAQPTIMHEVIGTVRMNNASGIPLPGITVQAENGLFISATTNDTGHYNLGDIPGVDNALNQFSATAPQNYQITRNGDAVFLDCQPQTISQQFSGPYTTKTIDFVLDCQEITSPCVPDWDVGPWGQCVPYGTEYVKLRTVTDQNACGILTDRPISVLTQNTPDPEGQDFDCPTSTQLGSLCGDGEVTGFEQCDIDRDTGITYYRHFPDGTISTDAPACSTVGLTGGNLGCTADCGFDYSQCQDFCAVCDDVAKCDTCPSCQNSPLCQNTCDEQAPSFLDEFTDSQRQNTRNILDSYANLEFPTGVYYTQGTSDVKLRWRTNLSASCQQNIVGHRIIMCEESGVSPNTCAQGTKNSKIVQQTLQEAIFASALQENTNYCYNVCTLTADGQEHCAVDADGTLPCFNSGDLYCHQPRAFGLICATDSFGGESPTGCYVETIRDNVYTNNTFQTVEFCSASETCVHTPFQPNNPLATGAACVQSGPCELCNGLFDQFSPYNFEVQMSFSTGSTLLFCEDFEYDPSQPLATPEPEGSQIGLCYLDMRGGFFETYDSCDEVRSCYDYQTEGACSQDPCFRFTDLDDNQAVNGCSWQSYSDELGLGVCQPVEVQDQNCTLCDTDSPIGTCNENFCGLYGDCFFKETQNHNQSASPPRVEQTVFRNADISLPVRHSDPFLPACLAQETIGCFFYETEEQCVGTNNQAFEINVFYDGNQRIAGTNEPRQLSNDLFGRGTCQWVDQGGVQGCFSNRDGYVSSINPFYDDCFERGTGSLSTGVRNSERLDCILDNEAPETTLQLRSPVQETRYQRTDGSYLPVYGKSQLSEILFTVEDSTWESERLLTYVALAPASCAQIQCYMPDDCDDCTTDSSVALACLDQGCPTYPVYTLDDYLPGGDGYTNLSDDSQEYVLLYYSMDPARNLEVVNHSFIFIDKTSPELVSFETKEDSFDVAPRIYRTNLTVSFEIDKSSFCEGRLHDHLTGQVIGGQHVASFGTDFNATYLFLQDGYYYFNLTCYDDFGNDLVYQEDITIEANPSIFNILPRGGVYRNLSSVVLELQTVNDATCKFDTEQRPHAQARGTFSQTGGTTHIHRLDSFPSSLGIQAQESRPYIFYFSCEFSNEITEQEPGDYATFTIDRLAPTVSVLARDTLQEPFTPYFPTLFDWVLERELRLVCDDFDSQIPIQQFGCQEIEYCFGPAVDLATFDPLTHCQGGVSRTTSSEVDLLLSVETHARSHLYFRAVDRGGNQGDWLQINPKVRNIVFEEPTIFFIP